MRVLVDQRQYWIDKCKQMLQLIYDKRKQRDKAFVEKWRNESYLWGLITFNRKEKLPNVDKLSLSSSWIYPCTWYSEQEEVLKKIIGVLETPVEASKEIYLSNDDLERMGF